MGIKILNGKQVSKAMSWNGNNTMVVRPYRNSLTADNQFDSSIWFSMSFLQSRNLAFGVLDDFVWLVLKASIIEFA
jgi:hypothetical protein